MYREAVRTGGELFGEHGKGYGFLGTVQPELKRTGKWCGNLVWSLHLRCKLREIQSFDAQMTIIVCASDAAYVHSSISDEMYDVVKGSYEQVIKTDSLPILTLPSLKLRYLIHKHAAQHCANM